jgi:hypothetical protein
LSQITKDERESVWDGELEYAEKLLTEDVRNNSAWNHRFFIVFESGMGGENVIEREIRCVIFSRLSHHFPRSDCSRITQIHQDCSRSLA